MVYHKKKARISPCLSLFCGNDYPKKLSRIPAATAEPITPATLGPIACIRRKL